MLQTAQIGLCRAYPRGMGSIYISSRRMGHGVKHGSQNRVALGA